MYGFEAFSPPSMVYSPSPLVTHVNQSHPNSHSPLYANKFHRLQSYDYSPGELHIDYHSHDQTISDQSQPYNLPTLQFPSQFSDAQHISKALIISIQYSSYPINEELLHQLFNPYGSVEIIRICTVDDCTSVILQYQSISSAIAAAHSLQGRCIYPGCCRMHIQFVNAGWNHIIKLIGRNSCKFDNNISDVENTSTTDVISENLKLEENALFAPAIFDSDNNDYSMDEFALYDDYDNDVQEANSSFIIDDGGVIWTIPDTAFSFRESDVSSVNILMEGISNCDPNIENNTSISEIKLLNLAVASSISSVARLDLSELEEKHFHCPKVLDKLSTRENDNYPIPNKVVYDDYGDALGLNDDQLVIDTEIATITIPNKPTGLQHYMDSKCIEYLEEGVKLILLDIDSVASELRGGNKSVDEAIHDYISKLQFQNSAATTPLQQNLILNCYRKNQEKPFLELITEREPGIVDGFVFMSSTSFCQLHFKQQHSESKIWIKKSVLLVDSTMIHPWDPGIKHHFKFIDMFWNILVDRLYVAASDQFYFSKSSFHTTVCPLCNFSSWTAAHKFQFWIFILEDKYAHREGECHGP